MLRPRITPCLLLKNKGLVKTIQFKNPKYVGDPINAVKIFNEKEADELIVLDIDATSHGMAPDYLMIENLATECRMPFCYGGGVKTALQAQQIIALGVEKIAVSSAAVERPDLVAEMAEQVGSQSVVVVLDVRKASETGSYHVWTHNGTKNSGKCPVRFAQQLEKFGAGEIVVNSIDHDGMMKGYDLEVSLQIRDSISIPMTILGGAGSLIDISDAISKLGIIGAAAGSLFVFKGAYKAVLINYPSQSERGKYIRLPTS